MAFDVPTLDDIHGFLLGLFAFLKPNADISQGSYYWNFFRTFAAGVTGNDAHIDADDSDLMPDTAAGPMQDRWAIIVGRPRKGATQSRGSKALRVFGTPTETVPALATLTSIARLTYQITTGDVVGAGGFVDVDLVSVDAGADTMLTAGATLSFTTTPPGLEESAELQDDLEDGTDEESQGALSIRIVDRFQSPPLGGAQGDYDTWAEQVTGIATSFEYPLRAGRGTVDIVGLHDGTGTDRILTGVEVASLQAYVDTKRPVSMGAGNFRVLTVTGVLVDVDFTYVSDGSLENIPDWDDTTPGEVLAWTAGTRTLQFTGGARPPTLEAGDRISIKPAAGGGNGVQRVVESLSGADSVVLEQATGVDDPAATDTIYAGGPLVEPQRQAIIALFNGLGSANPDAHRYGSWEGNIRPSALGRVCTGVTGVLDGTVVDPPATVEALDPAFPDDGTIELLIPGRILVRAQH